MIFWTIKKRRTPSTLYELLCPIYLLKHVNLSLCYTKTNGNLPPFGNCGLYFGDNLFSVFVINHVFLARVK